MINTLSKRIICKILIIVLTLSIVFSSLSSCGIFEYVAESKEEIVLNVEQSKEKSQIGYVADYLREWGLPSFDTIKFKYMEELIHQLYNYGDGLPSIYSHAVQTVSLFVEYLYDDTDLKNTRAVTDALLLCYTSSLDDPYTIYRAPSETDDFLTDMSGEFGGIGVMIKYDHENKTISIDEVASGSPAEKAGLKSGDFIYAIDGKTVESIGYDKAVDYVRGEIGTDVQITVIRDEEYMTYTVTRGKIIDTSVSYEIDLNSGIGYIKITNFKRNTPELFKDAITYMENQHAKGIIFDLRGNPGGYVSSVTDVISYLVPDNQLVVSYQYKGQSSTNYVTGNDSETPDHVVNLPFVVLCNKGTASAGEIFTSTIRDYRDSKLLNATIVGTNTYGKGIMQNTYYYFDGSSITMTVAYYNPPSGVNYHGIGVVPDVIVENDDSDIDLQLDAAYTEMQKLLNAK